MINPAPASAKSNGNGGRAKMRKSWACGICLRSVHDAGTLKHADLVHSDRRIVRNLLSGNQRHAQPIRVEVVRLCKPGCQVSDVERVSQAVAAVRTIGL